MADKLHVLQRNSGTSAGEKRGDRALGRKRRSKASAEDGGKVRKHVGLRTPFPVTGKGPVQWPRGTSAALSSGFIINPHAILPNDSYFFYNTVVISQKNLRLE